MAKPVDSLSLERRVDVLFAKYAQPGSPGAVVGVMRGGHVELVKGYGLASIELGVPISEKTRFRIASVTKQFTVTAALMLAHEGKLKLSDPPHKYLKELAPLPVTVDQMMRNSSCPMPRKPRSGRSPAPGSMPRNPSCSSWPGRTTSPRSR